VLTFVQLGAPFELEALRMAARVAAAADRTGLQYVCEIMPVNSARFPNDTEPEAIAAAARTASELGAAVIKTTMPDPPEGISEAVSCSTPVIVAGGARTADTHSLLASVSSAISAGAAGVAFGRNVWGAQSPAFIVSELHAAVHGPDRASSGRLDGKANA
jgi:DhnA family fructose-bisphosphate aldolase class Ia